MCAYFSNEWRRKSDSSEFLIVLHSYSQSEYAITTCKRQETFQKDRQNDLNSSYSYEEFEKLFLEQEHILDDDLSMRIGDAYSTADILTATNESTECLCQKIYDIANLYLVKYDSSYAISKDEIDDMCENSYNEIVSEREKNDPYFWTGGTMDAINSNSIYWDATKDILKKYYYELYKHTGTVEIDLGVG